MTGPANDSWASQRRPAWAALPLPPLNTACAVIAGRSGMDRNPSPDLTRLHAGIRPTISSTAVKREQSVRDAFPRGAWNRIKCCHCTYKAAIPADCSRLLNQSPTSCVWITSLSTCAPFH